MPKQDLVRSFGHTARRPRANTIEKVELKPPGWRPSEGDMGVDKWQTPARKDEGEVEACTTANQHLSRASPE